MTQEEMDTQVHEQSPEVNQEEVAYATEETEERKKEDPKESFANLRRAREKAEREKEEYARKIAEYERMLQAQQKPQQPEEDDEINIAPDDLAEGKHLTKVGRKIKRLEEQLKQYEQKSNQSSIESRLRYQYPDFDKVVNADTIDQLKEQHPEIAATLNSSSDLYSTASSAYKLIKQFGIYQQETIESKQADRNATKPRPLASVAPQQGDSPLSRANAFAQGLTDDLKKELHREMIQAMKRR